MATATPAESVRRMAPLISTAAPATGAVDERTSIRRLTAAGSWANALSAKRSKGIIGALEN
jgi:hypothetical protein